ncbi:unnamed protein product [Pleuronectes platessa]|uniref:Uncharacterized protein n=1 Tax=Pleuronectes platessa TaxID=8262 RepID=A0A9N7V8M2_PLEPL|nr:unnamed protein product [Pleuronectes platessa]
MGSVIQLSPGQLLHALMDWGGTEVVYCATRTAESPLLTKNVTVHNGQTHFTEEEGNEPKQRTPRHTQLTLLSPSSTSPCLSLLLLEPSILHAAFRQLCLLCTTQTGGERKRRREKQRVAHCSSTEPAGIHRQTDRKREREQGGGEDDGEQRDGKETDEEVEKDSGKVMPFLSDVNRAGCLPDSCGSDRVTEEGADKQSSSTRAGSAEWTEGSGRLSVDGLSQWTHQRMP